MWQQADDGSTRNREEALSYRESSSLASYAGWRLPNAKELQGIVDYTQAPDAQEASRRGPAIDATFILSESESWFWTGTTLMETPSNAGLGKHAVYLVFWPGLRLHRGKVDQCTRGRSPAERSQERRSG